MSEEKFSGGEWGVKYEPCDQTVTIMVCTNDKELFCVTPWFDNNPDLKESMSNMTLASEAKNMYNLLKELKGVSMGVYPEIIEKQLSRSLGENNG